MFAELYRVGRRTPKRLEEDEEGAFEATVYGEPPGGTPGIVIVVDKVRGPEQAKVEARLAGAYGPIRVDWCDSDPDPRAIPQVEARADAVLAAPGKADPAEVHALVFSLKFYEITRHKYEKLKDLSAIFTANPGLDLTRHVAPFPHTDLSRMRQAGIIKMKAGGDRDPRLGFWAKA